MPNRIERNSALPLDLLVDEAVFDLEVRHIWHDDWVFAAPVDAVSEPGDHVVVQIGRQSVIVVRGADLAIHALANACSHRGTPLVTESGNTRRFTCPYHAWTYGDDGALLSVPYSSTDEVPRERHGLMSYRTAQWHGLVFVSLNDDVEPLEERLALIDPYVRPLALDRLHHDVAGHATEVWNANWKPIYSAAIDSYSNFQAHAETIEPVSPTDAAYYLAGSARSTVTGGESMQRADHVVIAIPPSFVAVAWPDTMLWRAVSPVDVERTSVRIGMASQTPPGDAVAVNLPGWDAAFIDEDRTLVELIQRNARTPFVPGPLLDIEAALGDFHDYLAWRLTGADPENPVIAAAPGDRPEPSS